MDSFNYETLKSIESQKLKATNKHSGVEFECSVDCVEPGVLDGEQWEAFSVCFINHDKDKALQDGHYLFSHQAFGDVELYGSLNSATELEVIVTRKK